MPLVFGVSLTKSYLLFALINQSLTIIYCNDRMKVLFPATKLISKGCQALGTRLTYIKINEKTDQPTVLANVGSGDR